MLAGWKLDPGLGLPRAKRKVCLVVRDRLLGVDRFVHIDQQMVMAAVLVIVAGMRHAHVAQAETGPEPALDRCAVLRPNEIQNGILACGLSLSISRARP